MTCALFRRQGSRWPLRFVLLGLCALGAIAAAAAPQVDSTAADDEAEHSRTIRRYGDRISIFSDDIEIPEGTFQDGTVFCIGCDIRIAGQAREVVIIGGSLDLTGEVRGQVVGVLSNLRLDGAEIRGQLVNAAGTLDRHDSYVGGQLFDLGLGNWIGSVRAPFGIIGAVVFWLRLFKLFVAFVIILLLVTVVPERLRLIGEEAPVRYGTAVFVGLLGYLGVVLLGGLIAMTVIGIPFVLLIFLVMKWLGIAGMLYAFGRRIGRSLGREMSLLGAVLLAFAIFAALTMAPSVAGRGGWWLFLPSWGLITVGLWFFVEVPALGLVILTRAGSRASRAATVGPPPFEATPAPASPGPPEGPGNP